MSPLITLMHPYWKKILTNQHIFERQCTFSSYYLLQYKHCQSDQQGISSFTSRRRSNFLLLCLLRALSRSSSYLSWYRSLQQLFYRKYCIARCWHRAWRNVPTLLIDFSTSLRYYVCVLASHISMRVESLCVRAPHMSMCLFLYSLWYVCGEFHASRVCRVCVCVSDFMCVVVHFICTCLSTDVDELTP